MRRYFSVFTGIILLLCLIILCACSGNRAPSVSGFIDANTTAPLPSDHTQNTDVPQETDPKNLVSLPAETDRNPMLEAVIINEIGFYSEDDIASTRYYYNLIDLNNDGVDEVFVELVGPYTSGTGGDTGLLFAQDNDTYKLIQKFTLISNPIIVSTETTNGWRDMILTLTGGGAPAQQVRMQYDGSQYPSPSQAKPLAEDTEISGTAIISNDIAAEFQVGRGLYLESE